MLASKAGQKLIPDNVEKLDGDVIIIIIIIALQYRDRSDNYNKVAK